MIFFSQIKLHSAFVKCKIENFGLIEATFEILFLSNKLEHTCTESKVKNPILFITDEKCSTDSVKLIEFYIKALY